VKKHPSYLNVARAIVASIADDPWEARERADAAFSPQALANSPRPPNDRNQGRKPIKEGQATVSMTIRLTAGQREKLATLGGAQWMRDKIDKAKNRC